MYDVKLGSLIPMEKDNDGNVQGQIQIMDKTIWSPEFYAGKSDYKALVGRDMIFEMFFRMVF